MNAVDVGMAESLSAVWSALHDDADLIIHEDEVHYLRMLALAADDECVSHLLLKKLRMARILGDAEMPNSIISLNSFCEYKMDGGQARFCQLVHPSPHAPNYGLSVLSLAGAGLIGLRAGQTILWPDEAGALHTLHVERVENCPGLGDWLGSAPVMEPVHA
jgi:regulator of nucleoside diphosphate kinase